MIWFPSPGKASRVTWSAGNSSSVTVIPVRSGPASYSAWMVGAVVVVARAMHGTRVSQRLSSRPRPVRRSPRNNRCSVLFPWRVPRRRWVTGIGQVQVGRPARQLSLPQAPAVAVAAAAICPDGQRVRLGLLGPAPFRPPPAEGRDRARGGVGVAADGHLTGVVTEVIVAIRIAVDNRFSDLPWSTLAPMGRFRERDVDDPA